MADFSSLKQTIQSYIKQNGNEEITGNILQDVLLAMVSTMGDSAINSLASALQDEITARQNQDRTLQGNITAEATARQQADTALGGRIDGLQTVTNGINTKLAEGYIYAGIATPSTNPGTPSGKVFYIAVQAGTYTNFGGTVVAYGINILKYDGSTWSLDQIIAIDARPKKASKNIVTSGGVFDNIGALDVSELNATENPHTLAQYADLSAALAAIPTDYQKGGMSVKFVHSSDNKYVQARCTASEFTTDVTKWQGVDDEPITGSGNLVKSGGVAVRQVKLYAIVQYQAQLDGNEQIGDIFYQTTLNRLFKIESGSHGSWETSDVPFRSDAIYICNNHIYTYNGSVLVRIDVDKQDILQSGTNIKTINGQSVLGNGDIHINTTDMFVQYDKTILTEHGYYDLDDGTFHETQANLYSASIPVSGYKTLLIKGDQNDYFREGCCFFDSNGFVAAVNNKASYQLIHIPEGITTIKVTFIPYDDVSIVLCKEYVYNDIEVAEANASVTENAENIAWVDNKRVAVSGNVGQTATISVGDNSNCKYIMTKVSKGDIFVVTARMLANITYAIIDNNNVILEKSADGEPIYNKTIAIKENGTIIINTYKSFLNSAIRYIQANDTRLKNKTIAIFGDSIMEFKNSGGKGVVEYISEITGANVIRCAFGGAGLANRSSSKYPVEDLEALYATNPSVALGEAANYTDLANLIPDVVAGTVSDVVAAETWAASKTSAMTPTLAESLENIQHINLSNVDIVVISAGTNNSRISVIGNTSSTNNKEIMGAMNNIVNSLLTAYPHLSIYFFTPIVRYYDDDLSKWCDDVSAEIGGQQLKLSNYVNAIVDCSKYNHIPCCDMFSGMGWTRYNFTHFCVGSDYVHPYNGFDDMAEKMSSFILSNLNRY